MKEFAVIGLGNFGATVARELSTLKCKVTAIDMDSARVEELQDEVHTAIVANASERKFLDNLEVEKFDCFVVSTGVDSHASILIALHLRELNAKQVIVKANSDDHAKILRKVGADEAIIPEEQMAVRLSHSLAQSNLIDYLPLASDHYVAELVPPESFLGKSLSELQLRVQYNIQVIAVKNKFSGDYNLVLNGDFKISDSDVLVVLGKGKDIEKIKQ